MLLAGPGTGKTTNIKAIVDDEFSDARQILVLSFTNATVHDLTASFEEYPQVKCYTLHSFALKINHLTDYYILDSSREAPRLRKLANDLEVDFSLLCRLLRCITFDAMILECLNFLKTNPVYGKDQIGTLDLLIVDEYQDFNEVERELVNAISKHATETIILGDDDQSIYGFKDADPDGIIQIYNQGGFEEIEHANNCYRCPDAVVMCATNLIQHNKNRIDKPWHATGREGDCVHNQFRTQEETNKFILAEIEKIKTNDDVTSILVLSPVRFYVDELVKLLEERGIEFVDFWTSAIDTQDYLHVWRIRAILSSRRLLNLIFLSSELTAHFKRKFKEVLRHALQKKFDPQDVLDQIMPMFGTALAEHIKNPPTLEHLAETTPELAELVVRINPDDLEASLDSLLKDINPSKTFTPGAVNIMSIHKSKGLQADVVFISGLVDGVLPNNDEGIDTIEAQRRLLFVGVTRAVKSLKLLSTVEWDGRIVHRVDKSQFKFSPYNRKYKGKTSKFVIEMK